MARHVKMMVLDGCPHCRHAVELMDELIEENREAGKTQGYDYWYVPTFFVDDVKVHEGVPTKDKVERVFTEALK